MPKVPYRLNLQKRGISLNAYFGTDFRDVWAPLFALDLYIEPANLYPITKSLSYRHRNPLKRGNDPELKQQKYLAQDAVDFILLYIRRKGATATDLEGLWIDCLCIAPAGQLLQDAFEYMGRLYCVTVVIPYWMRQNNPKEAFQRAWIFQECRFPQLDTNFMTECIPQPLSENLLEICSDLYSIRMPGNSLSGGTLNDYLPCFQSSVCNITLSNLFSSYVKCTADKEEDILEAIFGVLNFGLVNKDLSTLSTFTNFALNFLRSGTTQPVNTWNGMINLTGDEIRKGRIFRIFPELENHHFVLIGSPRSQKCLRISFLNNILKLGKCPFEEIFIQTPPIRRPVYKDLLISYYICPERDYLQLQENYVKEGKLGTFNHDLYV